jgi:hypothetical protein
VRLARPPADFLNGQSRTEFLDKWGVSSPILTRLVETLRIALIHSEIQNAEFDFALWRTRWVD